MKMHPPKISLSHENVDEFFTLKQQDKFGENSSTHSKTLVGIEIESDTPTLHPPISFSSIARASLSRPISNSRRAQYAVP
jgi:hypothetical protein